MKADVLILHGFGLAALGPQERHDFLEAIKNSHGECSLVIAGQLPGQGATRP